MNINLYTTDQDLYSLCRDIVHLTPQIACTLKTYAIDEELSPEEIGVYDVSGECLQDLIRRGNLGHSIVVLSSKDLPQVRNDLLSLGATVLLKPITRARIEIALEQVCGAPLQSRTDKFLRNDRDELLQHLLRANLKLQEHDQDRAHCLARAVHELRAPLTPLCGYCDLLLEGRLGALSTDQHTVISRMHHSISRLSGIVSSIFQLSVGQNDLPTLARGNYFDAVRQAVHELAPLFEERGIDLSIQLAPYTGVISFDPRQMEQVFINLLDNCCKFTPRGGSVKVIGYPFFWERRFATSSIALSAERRRGSREDCFNSYRIEVSDSGPGIAPEHLDAIFEEYTAFGDCSNRSGAGLGLAICKMIVTRHRGAIWAASPGCGATFSVLLPLSTH